MQASCSCLVPLAPQIAFSHSTSRVFGEDAFEEFASWFHIRMFLAPVFGQPAFDGGSANSGSVAFEVDLDALQIGDGLVEAGELFFDLRDDGRLLFWWRYRYFISKKFGRLDTVDRSSLL